MDSCSSRNMISMFSTCSITSPWASKSLIQMIPCRHVNLTPRMASGRPWSNWNLYHSSDWKCRARSLNKSKPEQSIQPTLSVRVIRTRKVVKMWKFAARTVILTAVLRSSECNISNQQIKIYMSRDKTENCPYPYSDGLWRNSYLTTRFAPRL